MTIDTIEKLEAHLKIFKMKQKKNGAGEFDLYPIFCKYYTDNIDKYKLGSGIVLDKACEILI